MDRETRWLLHVPILVILAFAGWIVSMVHTPVEAQGQGTTAVHDAYAFESIPVSTAAVRISASLVAPTGQGNARQAYCTVLANSINVRYDGTDPTNSVGHTYAAGTNFTLWGANNIRRLRAIRVSADATLQCTLLR